MLRAATLGCLATFWTLSAAAQSSPAPATSWQAAPGGLREALDRFTLFPGLGAAVPALPSWEAEPSPERLLHVAGDPDSLLSFGQGGRTGEPRLLGAIEVNEVLLKAIAPDPRVQASDPRGRLTGDFRALDVAGRPYQLRLGARLVW